MLAPIAAVTASFSASLLAELGLKISPDVVTLAALVTFLPGMALTIGMREVATQHLQSGVANTANALVQLLGLVFGVGVGRSIAANWFGVPHQNVAHQSFSSIYVLAAAAAGLAFTVTLRAPLRSAPVMCSAAILAILVNAAGKALLGAPAGVFVAALALGVVGGVSSIPLRRSPLVFIVPGILMLVPGKRRVQQPPPAAHGPDRERDRGRLQHVRHRDGDRLRAHALRRDPAEPVHPDRARVRP